MTLGRFRTRLAPSERTSAGAPVGTKLAPPVEESDEQSDKYSDQDDGPEDA